MHTVPDSVGFGISLDDEDGLQIPSEEQLWMLSDTEMLQVLKRARALRKQREGMRQRVMERDNSRCRYCGCRTYGQALIDYVMPLARGGRTELDNLVSACESCHAQKRGRTLDQAGMALMDVLPA